MLFLCFSKSSFIVSVSDVNILVPDDHCTSDGLHLCDIKKVLPDLFTTLDDDLIKLSDTKEPPLNLPDFPKDDTSGFDKNNMMTARCPVSVSATRNTDSLV